MYMRSSMSAQSFASVPPTPAEIVRKQLRWSCLPESKDCISTRSIRVTSVKSCSSASFNRSASLLSRDISYATLASSKSRINAANGSVCALRNLTFATTFCARSWLSQKPSPDIWTSNSFRLLSLPSKLKRVADR